MADVTARPLQVSARLPTKEDAEAMGARKIEYLEKAPYVKEKLTGMIWYWQDWMFNMGDVLESCWTAPPTPGILVPSGPLDIAHYAAQPDARKAATSPQAQAPAPPVLPASEQSARPQRKGQQRKVGSRPTSAGDGNAR